MDRNPVRRNTKQRQVILEELRKLTSHPSAATLYELVRMRMPNISLGTVYRNLDLLADSGAIQKLNSGTPEARYDGNPDQHYHVACTFCGRVDDIHDAPHDLVRPIGSTLGGFEILGHQLQFIGICPKCRTNKPDRISTKIH